MERTISTRNQWMVYLIIFWIFQIPFSVSNLYNEISPILNTTIVINLFGGCVFFYMLLKKVNIFINFEEKTIVRNFICAIGLSSINVILTVIRVKGDFFNQYIYSDFFPRLINYSICLLFFLILCQLLKQCTERSAKIVLYAYLFGVSILLFVGIWQILSFYFQVPIFNLQTRDFVHSVTLEDSMFLKKRVTSIANEPSYLAPFCIDGFLISFLMPKSIKRGVFQTACLIVLFFSYSGGGFVEIVCLLLVYIFCCVVQRKRKNILWIVIGTVLFLLLCLLFWNEIFMLAAPVLGRSKNLFSLRSSRIYMVVMPFKWIFEMEWNNLLFGCGPGSYSYLSLTKTFPWGGSIHSTSNNILTDFYWECGLVGAGLLLSMFYHLWVYVYKQLNAWGMVPCFLLIHLLLSSMYRADFASLRFWFLLAVICNIKVFKPLKVKRG